MCYSVDLRTGELAGGPVVTVPDQPSWVAFLNSESTRNSAVARKDVLTLIN